MVEGQEDQSRRDKELQGHVDGRDDDVWHAQLVGHQLVGMFAVCLAEVLVQLYAVADGQDGVGAVHGQEGDVGEVLRLEYQPAEGKKKYEGYGDRADVAGKAACPAPEVKQAENDQAQPRDVEVRHGDEWVAGVEIYQRQQHCYRVAAGDAVDAVHEVVGVDDANTDNERHYNYPPVGGVEDAELIEHQPHGGELDDEAHAVGQRPDVVGEADQAHKAKSGDKPCVLHAEQRPVQPGPEQEDDTSATEHHCGVGAAQVGFVDDVEAVGHAEVGQLEHDEQYRDDGIYHGVGLDLCLGVG